MREVKLSPYILLGSSVRFLLDVREGLLIHQASGRKEMSLMGHISRVENSLGNAALRVAQRAFQSELGEVVKTLKTLPKSATLTQKQAESIIEGIRTVSDVLKFEGVNLQAYVIADKRLPIDKLLSNVSGLFAEWVYFALPDIAQYDFTQAGKCIAFELPTSAAFHTLRGTESVIRSYYSALVTNPSSGPLLWGPMIAELRKINSDAPPKELLDNLDNIRVSFRNPTQHPEKRYDIDEAQDLFNLCVDVGFCWVSLPFNPTYNTICVSTCAFFKSPSDIT